MKVKILIPAIIAIISPVFWYFIYMLLYPSAINIDATDGLSSACIISGVLSVIACGVFIAIILDELVDKD